MIKKRLGHSICYGHILWIMLFDVMYNALDNKIRTGKARLVTHSKKVVKRMSFMTDPKGGGIQSSYESDDIIINMLSKEKHCVAGTKLLIHKNSTAYSRNCIPRRV